MESTAAQIPDRLIFLWFGEDFPVTNLIALRSAIRKCRPRECLLVVDGTAKEALAPLAGEPGLVVCEADGRWFEGVPEGATLARSFAALRSPAARANLLRLVILWREGGIYLDTDTITVRDLGPLRRHHGFCGSETVCRPADWVARRRLRTEIAMGGRALVRGACARLPRGDRVFRRLRPLFSRAVNNAVVGARAQNPVLTRALVEISRMPEPARHERFRLGTHLLQSLTENRSSAEMEVLPDDYFYPLGPEVSRHLFRPGSAARLSTFVRPTTHVVHWYASLADGLRDGPLDEAWLRRHPTSAIAALATPYL
jgi:hypothetical protein